MNKAAQPKIYVAGHRGMVGSALVRNLLAQGIASENLITRSRQELDLTNQLAVQEFFLHVSGLTRFIWLQLKLAAFMRTTLTLPVSFTKI